MYGKDKAPNGCGYVRAKETAMEEEKKLYNCGMVSADTMFCHHLDKVSGPAGSTTRRKTVQRVLSAAYVFPLTHLSRFFFRTANTLSSTVCPQATRVTAVVSSTMQ